jgi:hypothetical protein
VRDQFPETTAHELGHIYGLYASLLPNSELYQQSPGCPTGSKDATAPLAYWVQKKKLVGADIKNYMCGSSDLQSFFFGGDSAVPDRWTTSQDWLAVGQKLTGLSFDPEVLIVSGYIDNTGKAGFGGLYRNETGTVDEDIDPGGSYALKVLSTSGKVLSSISFIPNFSVTDVPNFSSPLCPFVLRLAYPSDAAFIRIVNGTSVLASQSVAYGLLLRAENQLQDGAFLMDPTNRRNALVNMVNAFQHAIQAGNTKGAYSFLASAIAPHISSWLSDSYVAPNSLFYTKAALLSLVTELVQRGQ